MISLAGLAFPFLGGHPEMKTFPELSGCRVPPGNYPESLTSKLNSQRLEGKHCDVTLIHGSQRFPIHTGVLCAASDYFVSLLDGSFSESKQNDVDVTASFPSAEALETVLQYIYTGKLDIQENNFEDLLESVHFLMLGDAVKLIAEYLADSLVLENCIDVLMLSSKFGINELVTLSIQIIQSRLHDYLFQNDIEKLYALSPDLISHIANAFCHLPTKETVSFMKKYLLDLLNDQEEYSRSLLKSCKTILSSFKGHESDLTGNRDHGSNFCHAFDILSDDLIEKNPQIVGEKFYTEISVNGEQSLTKLLLKENHPHVGRTEEGNTAGRNTKFEEAILISTEQYQTNGQTIMYFYAYLTQANRWVEIHVACCLYESNNDAEDHKDMRFIGFSKGRMVFTPKQKHKSYSGYIVAFYILPDVSENERLSLSTISEATHICLNKRLDRVQFSDRCSHHMFVSGDDVFCIYPEVCCIAAAIHEANHRPEVGAYKVKLMDWRDGEDDGPRWNTVGKLHLPMLFRNNFHDSYHNPDGPFFHAIFLTAETASHTYILACSAPADNVRDPRILIDRIPRVAYAVFQMNKTGCQDDILFPLITSGYLEADAGTRVPWQFRDPNLALAAADGYLMLYNRDKWKFDVWKIQLDSVDPDFLFAHHVRQETVRIKAGSMNFPALKVGSDGVYADVPDPDDRPIQTIASSYNGQFYCLQNIGPYVNCLNRLCDFKRSVEINTNQPETGEASGSGSQSVPCQGSLYAERKHNLPPPPVDQVIKETAIALVPSNVIKHLEKRPNAQFQNMPLSRGPYHHDTHQVIGVGECNETPVDMSDQLSVAGSDISGVSLSVSERM